MFLLETKWMKGKIEMYFDNLKEPIKRYFDILSPEKPDFLEEYINIPEMQK